MSKYDENYDMVVGVIKQNPGIDILGLGEETLMDGMKLMAIIRRAIKNGHIRISEDNLLYSKL